MIHFAAVRNFFANVVHMQNFKSIFFPICGSDWLQAVQALMVLATLFCFISFIIFLCQLFTLNKGGRFFFTAVFHVFSSEYNP